MIWRFLVPLSFSCCMFTTVHAEDWPHWRGAARTGVIDETSGWANATWPPTGEQWQINVGAGSSSPLVVGNQVFVMGWANQRDTLHCLELADGKTQWKVDYPCPQYGRYSVGDKGLYSGPSSTPAFDPQSKRLYTLSTDGDLICWQTNERGKQVWAFNIYDRYHVKQRPDVGRRTQRDYGYTTSPLLFRNWVLVEVGDDEGTLMAFDSATGQRVWASECNEEAGHTASPVLMTVDGVPCLAVLTLRSLIVLRLDVDHAGQTIARYPWATDFANNIPTPVVVDNTVLITSAYNHYAMCRLKITLKGAEKLWETENPSGVCTPVVHKGKIYWAWRGVHCVELNSGRELWQGSKIGETGSCLVTRDDRLLIWADKGDLRLAETAERSPEKYTELSLRKNVGRDDAWPHVVLSNNRLLLKDRSGNLICFGVQSGKLENP